MQTLCNRQHLEIMQFFRVIHRNHRGLLLLLFIYINKVLKDLVLLRQQEKLSK